MNQTLFKFIQFSILNSCVSFSLVEEISASTGNFLKMKKGNIIKIYFYCNLLRNPFSGYLKSFRYSQNRLSRYTVKYFCKNIEKKQTLNKFTPVLDHQFTFFLQCKQKKFMLSPEIQFSTVFKVFFDFFLQFLKEFIFHIFIKKRWLLITLEQNICIQCVIIYLHCKE